MHVRGGSTWQTQSKTSSLGVGPLRRAHPASGATWNVQVVRGKMTSRCLWHACRALVLGIILMVVGGGMATIGYYANDISFLSDFKNTTPTPQVHVKSEHRLHLNNLSYLGPIIMGVGGFIVVASCVMTFEARDSAAKVMPARFKVSQVRANSRNSTSRRSTGISTGPTSTASQTSKWEHQLGVFRTTAAIDAQQDRQALTAALIHFSRNLMTPKTSPQLSVSRRVSKSGSVPNLSSENTSISKSSFSGSPIISGANCKRVVSPRVCSLVQRSTRELKGNYLHPGMLKKDKNSQSIDHPDHYINRHEKLGLHAAVHSTHSGEPLVHSHKRDRTRHSETARKHVLSRQRPIERDEHHSPKQNHFIPSRRSSTISDTSINSRRSRGRRSSTISKTPSVDSRGGHSTEVYSPDRSINCNSPTKRANSIYHEISTDKEYSFFRSQLSVSSDPTSIQRNLSCQSSLDPCVPEEESPELEDKGAIALSSAVIIDKPLREESIILGNVQNFETSDKYAKFLYRSNSTKVTAKVKPKMKPKMSNEFDQIFVISNQNSYHSTNVDCYDSIEVIHERRSKNFNKFNNDVACGENGTGNRINVVADISPSVTFDDDDDDVNCGDVVNSVDTNAIEHNRELDAEKVHRSKVEEDIEKIEVFTDI